MNALIAIITTAPYWNIGYINILSVSHALIVAWDLKKASYPTRLPVLQALLASYASALGGSSMTNILLGLSVSALSGNVVLPTYTIIILLVLYSPNDFVFKLLEHFRPQFLPFLAIMDSISTGYSIMNGGVDLVRSQTTRPSLANSVSASIICGTLSGCGGGTLNSMMNLSSNNWSFSTPKNISNPSLSVKVALFSATLYFILTDVSWLSFLPLSKPILDLKSTQTLICLIIIAVSLYSRITSLQNPASVRPVEVELTRSKSQEKTLELTPSKISPEKITHSKSPSKESPISVQRRSRGIAKVDDTDTETESTQVLGTPKTARRRGRPKKE